MTSFGIIIKVKFKVENYIKIKINYKNLKIFLFEWFIIILNKDQIYHKFWKIHG
jgi:hypothetical protein